MTWLESLPPLALVTGGIAMIGFLQEKLQLVFFGRLRKVGKDGWTRRILERDNRLWIEEYEAKMKDTKK